MPWELTFRHDHHLPHPAERIWDAVATGRGNRGWLYPMDIEPWVGGAVARGVGGTVGEWSPPHRLAVRIDDGDFASVLRYDVDDGGHLATTIQWVHASEDEPDAAWRRKADAAEAHAVFYHDGLRSYLDHFAGRDAVYVNAGTEPGAPRPPFPALLDELGVPAGAAAGDTVRYTPPTSPPRGAVVVHRSDDFVALRSAAGLHRFFNGDRWEWSTWTAQHLFGDDVAEAAEAQAWTEWLARAR